MKFSFSRLWLFSFFPTPSLLPPKGPNLVWCLKWVETMSHMSGNIFFTLLCGWDFAMLSFFFPHFHWWALFFPPLTLCLLKSFTFFYFAYFSCRILNKQTVLWIHIICCVWCKNMCHSSWNDYMVLVLAVGFKMYFFLKLVNVSFLGICSLCFKDCVLRQTKRMALR